MGNCFIIIVISTLSLRYSEFIELFRNQLLQNVALVIIIDSGLYIYVVVEVSTEKNHNKIFVYIRLLKEIIFKCTFFSKESKRIIIKGMILWDQLCHK